jgi:hypothetical protein
MSTAPTRWRAGRLVLAAVAFSLAILPATGLVEPPSGGSGAEMVFKGIETAVGILALLAARWATRRVPRPEPRRAPFAGINARIARAPRPGAPKRVAGVPTRPASRSGRAAGNGAAPLSAPRKPR